MKDPYTVLGVSRTATDAEIKGAYRRLASQHHPDKGGDKEKFQEIQQAYHILGDAERRREYDNPSRMHMHRGDPGFDFDSIFQMFGTRFHHGRSNNSTSARMQLWIGLADVVTGGPRTISVSSPAGQNNIEITIPAGIEDGAAVRYPRLAPGGVDLVVHFRIRPEPGWERQDENLIKDTMVSIWDLILGKEIEIATLSGKKLAVTIPPHTQPGTMLRLRGHGVPIRNTNSAGDLFVKLMPRLPNRISDELKDMIGRERDQ